MLFCFFSIPDAAIVLQGAVGDQDKITPLVTILPALIAKSASIANPIIYAISHPKYRLVCLHYISFAFWSTCVVFPAFSGFTTDVAMVLHQRKAGAFFGIWFCFHRELYPNYNYNVNAYYRSSFYDKMLIMLAYDFVFRIEFDILYPFHVCIYTLCRETIISFFKDIYVLY